MNLISGHRFENPLYFFSVFVEIFNNLFLITSIYYLLTFEIYFEIFSLTFKNEVQLLT